MNFGRAEMLPGWRLVSRLLAGMALILLTGVSSGLAQSVTGTGEFLPAFPGTPLASWNLGSQELFVADYYDATLTIANGGTVTNGRGNIGYNSGANGWVTVTGAGSTWTNTGPLHVGMDGYGELTIANGGAVVSAEAYLGSRSVTPGTGVVKVTGTGSIWTNSGELTVGDYFEGTLTIEKGGTVSATRTMLARRTSYSGAWLNLLGDAIHGRGVLKTEQVVKGFGQATLNFDGGILRAAANQADFISGFSAQTIGTNGAYFDSNGFDIGVSTSLDGTGSLTKQGAGKLTLSGTSSYSGGTTIAGGIVSISRESNLGSTSGTLTLDGGMLQVTGTTLSGLTRAIVLGAAGGGFDIVDAGNTFTATQSFSGAGSLIKAGTGTLALSGTNSYAGDTLVQAGRLVGDNASSFSSNSNVTVSAGATLVVSGAIFATAGSLSGAGTVEIASGATLFTGSTDQSRTFAGNFSGDGALGFTGAGTQIYTGTGTLGGGFATCVCATGQFVVRGGSLTFGDDVRVQGGVLLVDQGGHLDSGSGTLLVASKATVDGAGSSILTGITLVQSFAGTTSLTISSGASLTGSGGASLIGFGGTAEALVTGTGSRWTVGGGGLSIAPGATTATSVTVAEGGELRIVSGDLQIAALGRLNIGNGGRAGSVSVIAGAIVNDGAIVANFTDNYTQSGSITGGGTLAKTGAGTLTLSGTNTYTGATTVDAGKLIVNGSIASSSGVTIAAGAAIGGSGALPSLTINGTLAPGNSPGTLTVNGNLTLAAGSIYEAEIQGGISDRVNVTGSAGLAGRLRIIPLGGAYAFNNPYTLLFAAGGRAGTFSPINTTGSFGDGVATAVSYTSTEVLLTLAPKPLIPIVANPTPTKLGVIAPTNAYAIAAAIDGVVAAGGNPSSLFGIYNLPAASIPTAVNTLSGEIHTAVPALANVAADQFLRAMLDPMAAGRLDLGAPGPGAATLSGLVRKGADEPAAPARLDAPAYSVWGSAFGFYGRTDGDAAIGSARRTIDDAHLATGIDVRLMPGTVAGLAVSGGKAHASLPGVLGKIDADVFQAGLYGVTQFGPAKLGAAASYARLDNDVSRGIPTLGSTLSSSYETTAWSGRLQASAVVLDWNDLALSPLAAVQTTRARNPAITESNWAGANAGALAVGKRSDATSRSEVGLQLDANSVFGGVPVNGYVRASWAHYFQRDADLTASLVGLSGATFSATGAEADRNSALIAAGVSAKLSERVSLGLNLDGELSSNSRRLGGSTQIRVSF